MAFSSRRSREKAPLRQPKADSEIASNVFRRSRTLTGSVSSRVRAANEDGSHLRSPRLHEHDLRSRRRKISGILVASLGVAAGLVWLLDQLIVTPSIHYQPATAHADTARYTTIVEKYFNDRPLERFQFVLNPNTFSAYMVEEAPELSSAVITGSEGLASHDVLLGVRQPIALWQINDRHYYVDGSGVSFERNLLSAPRISVKDETGLPATSQQIVASTKMMRFIGRVVDVVSARIAPVDEVVIPPATLKEVDIIVKNRPYRIRLNIDRDPVEQANDVIATLQHLDARAISPQYIDARVSGRAFYKE